jgi:hypothetical protein
MLRTKSHSHFKTTRLAEGFFYRERSRKHFHTNESESYNDLHELVRNSSYYSRLPTLPIECVELDGIPDTLPILIEETYSTNAEDRTVIESISKSNGRGYENGLVQAVQNFSKNLIKGIWVGSVHVE